MPIDNKAMFEITLGRTSTGMVGGAATVVLAILGLVHLLPTLLVCVATIVLGAAILFKGAAISAEYSKLLSSLSGTAADKIELGGGMSVEIMTGGTGVVLGILALLGIDPPTLVSIAIIAFGAGVIMGGGVISRLNSLKLDLSGGAEGAPHHRVAAEIVSAALGTQVIAGLAAIVLGILSLIGVGAVGLNLVALLVLGAASLLTSSAITGKMVGMMHHS